MWTRPRETVALFPIDLAVDDQVTTTFDVAVTAAYGPRPTEFAPATVVDGQAGVVIEGLSPGDYWAYPRHGEEVLPPLPFRIT